MLKRSQLHEKTILQFILLIDLLFFGCFIFSLFGITFFVSYRYFNPYCKPFNVIVVYTIPIDLLAFNQRWEWQWRMKLTPKEKCCAIRVRGVNLICFDLSFVVDKCAKEKTRILIYQKPVEHIRSKSFPYIWKM